MPLVSDHVVLMQLENRCCFVRHTLGTVRVHDHLMFNDPNLAPMSRVRGIEVRLPLLP